MIYKWKDTNFPTKGMENEKERKTKKRKMGDTRKEERKRKWKWESKGIRKKMDEEEKNGASTRWVVILGN